MSSGAQSFYSTPAFELFRRALTTIAVTQFRGMNNFQTANQVQPNFALDCNNVIVSDTGGLEKMRLPVSISPAIAEFPTGPQSFWDYQYLNAGVPTRQIIANYFNSLYALNWLANGQFSPSLIEQSPSYNGPWSMVEANNIMFMANGIKMKKYLGQNPLEQWGIFAPGGSYSNGNTSGNPPSVVLSTATFGILASTGITVDASGNVTVLPAGGNAFDQFAGMSGIQLTPIATSYSPINGIVLTLNASVLVGGHVPSLVGTIGGVAAGTGGGGELTIPPLLFGHQWAYAYENSVTGHIGNRSAATVNAGVTGTSFGVYGNLVAQAPSDPQLDTVVWYRNLDGGGILYRIPNPANGGGNWPISQGGLSIVDVTPDSGLDTLTAATLINNPPPIARYLCKWQGRIIGANLPGAAQSFWWTGYEQILSGRPEESVPSNNRINLQIGAEAIAGVGAITPGVVFWSSTGTMWMLRGALQDITVNAPVLWSDYLEEMPWTMGAYAQNTVQATPGGLVWLAQDKSVNVFNGVSAPTCISTVVNPILRTITPGTEQQAVGSYFNWLDRNWYALSIATNGSLQLNRTIFFALEASTQDIDVFPSDIQCDFMSVLQTPDLQRILVISQNGQLYQLPVNSMTTGGVNQNPTSTTGELAAYWRSGYFGTDYPYRSKMWRYGVLIADNQGFSAITRYIDYRERTFRMPERVEQRLTDEMIELNNRAHLMSIEIDFPKQDIDCAVLELHAGYIGTADRQS